MSHDVDRGARLSVLIVDNGCPLPSEKLLMRSINPALIFIRLHLISSLYRCPVDDASQGKVLEELGCVTRSMFNTMLSGAP